MNLTLRHTIAWLHRIMILILVMCISFSAISQDDSDYDYGNNDNDEFVFDQHEGTVPRLYKRNVSEQQVKEWQEDDAFWYANKDFEKKKNEAAPGNSSGNYIPFTQRPWFQTILWILIIGGFMGVVFWFLSENKVGIFNRKRENISEEISDEIPEDIFAINYQKEIDQAVRLENYRLAVRLMFLRLLKTMSEKNIIQYKQDKTNLDYLLDTHGQNYYTDFFKVVRDYEYSWYGLFEINRDTFAAIKKDYDQLDKALYRF